MRLIALLVCVSNHLVGGIRFATVGNPDSSTLDCSGLDLIVSTSISLPAVIPCTTSVLAMSPVDSGVDPERILNTPVPFMTKVVDDTLFVLLDRTRVTGPLSSFPIPELSAQWRVLILTGILSDADSHVVRDEWRMDAVVARNATVGNALNNIVFDCIDESGICYHTLVNRVLESSNSGSPEALSTTILTRRVILPVAGCASNDAPFDVSFPMLSMAATINRLLDVTFCVIRIDGRVAHFDNQLEWLQANLQEEPCRTSDWVIVRVFGSSLDEEVVDLLDNYALVDLLLVDTGFAAPLVHPTVVYSDGSHALAFTDREMSMHPVCDANAPEVSHTSSKRVQRQQLHGRKLLSKTANSNVFIAMIIAVLSGLAVNISYRKSVARRIDSGYITVPVA